LFNKFLATLSKKKWIKGSDQCLIAVSGGIDSMVLLHLIQQTDFDFYVAHVDHSTRDGGSSKDAEFVNKYCLKYKIPVETLKLNPVDYEGGNLQAYFRERRYSFFNKLNPDKILTAHHADDKVESVFINFLTGKSLKSIPELNQKIVRPLLGFTRMDIETYAKENQVPFVEDSSNNETKYFRNFLRHDIIPKIEERDKNLNEKILAFSQRWTEDQKLLSDLAEELLRPEKGDYISIKKTDLLQQSPRLAYHYLKSFGFSETVAQNLYETIENTGRRFHSVNHEMLIDRELIFIKPLNSNLESVEIDLELLPLEKTFGTYQFKFNLVNECHDFSNPSVACFPIEKLNTKLHLRSWAEEDAFQPFGMNGQTQSLKKFFANNKVNRFDKKATPLLISGNEIIWVVGLRTSEKYRCSNAGQYLKVEATKMS